MSTYLRSMKTKSLSQTDYLEALQNLTIFGQLLSKKLISYCCHKSKHHTLFYITKQLWVSRSTAKFYQKIFAPVAYQRSVEHYLTPLIFFYHHIFCPLHLHFKTYTGNVEIIQLKKFLFLLKENRRNFRYLFDIAFWIRRDLSGKKNNLKRRKPSKTKPDVGVNQPVFRKLFHVLFLFLGGRECL